MQLEAPVEVYFIIYIIPPPRLIHSELWIKKYWTWFPFKRAVCLLLCLLLFCYHVGDQQPVFSSSHENKCNMTLSWLGSKWWHGSELGMYQEARVSALNVFFSHFPKLDVQMLGRNLIFRFKCGAIVMYKYDCHYMILLILQPEDPVTTDCGTMKFICMSPRNMVT